MVTSAAAMRFLGLALGLAAALLHVAALEDLGRPVGHRQRFGRDVGQDLVLDLDRADGVAGLLLGLGGDGGDVVAVIAERRSRPWRSRSPP